MKKILILCLLITTYLSANKISVRDISKLDNCNYIINSKSISIHVNLKNNWLIRKTTNKYELNFGSAQAIVYTNEEGKEYFETAHKTCISK